MSTIDLPPVMAAHLRFFRWHYNEVGIPPSVRDIQRAFKLKSPFSVHRNLLALHRRGFLKRVASGARNYIPA